MLKIVFYLGTKAYSIPVDRVTEVLPLVPLRTLPGAADFVAGLLNYRGESVPVIDLCKIVTGQPASRRFSTRIVVIQATVKNGSRFLGLIAEGVTDTVQSSQDTSTADIETVLPSTMYDFLLDSAAL